MKRIGVYDAFDKWELLCRYWEDRGSAAEIGTDKVNKPLVPKWHHMAMMRGLRFGIEYLASRIESPRPRLPTGFFGDPQAAAEASVEAEIAQLAAQLGPAGLQSSYHQLIEAITASGFQTPFDDGLSPRLAARLRQVFKQGALEALQWTEDDGELPSLPVLRYWAPRFPDAALRRKSNGLCMFCCRFYGRADVIHVHDAGPDNVTLVDNDAPVMADMKLIYPSSWKYITADYKEFLGEAARFGWSYDIIVADPWLFMAREVAWDFLPMIMNICSDTFMTNYSEEMFSELNLPPTDLVGLSQAVSERTGTEIVFTQIMPRSSPAYWAIMRKKPLEAGARAADAPSRQLMGDDSRSADEVAVVGPTKWWSEVSPEGSLDVEEEAPVLTYPQHGTTTGPSPRLRCGFFRQDNGEPVDIVVQITGGEGITNFRFKLGALRDVDLRKLGVALPAGEAIAWAVYRRSPEARWAMYRRVDFRIELDAPNATDIA